MNETCRRTAWPSEAADCSAARSGSARRTATSVMAEDISFNSWARQASSARNQNSAIGSSTVAATATSIGLEPPAGRQHGPGEDDADRRAIRRRRRRPPGTAGWRASAAASRSGRRWRGHRRWRRSSAAPDRPGAAWRDAGRRAPRRCRRYWSRRGCRASVSRGRPWETGAGRTPPHRRGPRAKASQARSARAHRHPAGARWPRAASCRREPFPVPFRRARRRTP